MRGVRCYMIVLVLALAGCFAGCASGGKQYQSGYETVGKDPRRDTEKAKHDNQQAVKLIDDGNYSDAEKGLRSALTYDVMYGPAHNNLGKVYYQQKKFYLAAWEFQYAIRVMPTQAEPQNNLGLVYEVASKLEDAMGCYAKAHDLASGEVQYIGNLARVRVKLGKRDAATRELLVQIIMRDSREDWIAWAKRELATLPRAATEPTTRP